MIPLQTWIPRYLKKLLICFLVLPFLGALWLTFGLGYRVLFNTTNSLSHIMYLTNPTRAPIKPGDLIAFQHHASSKTVVKRVIGVEGDRISRTQNALIVKGKAFPLKEKRSNGEALTPLNANVIPTGMVFVAGEHIDSFDSRYNAFGLVPISTIKGRVWVHF